MRNQGFLGGAKWSSQPFAVLELEPSNKPWLINDWLINDSQMGVP